MERLGNREYEDHLKALQLDLNDLAHWLQHTGRRLLVVLEGRDTAGKGGTINAITQRLNPRQVHVAALPKPSDREKGQWYFQRYAAHLPSPGELVLFDRSWYNRAGVEKVMGFCTEAEYRRFLGEAPVFERMLADDGILILKYWLSVDQEQQEDRFAERAADPLKRWKLSPVDLQARARYADYGKARDAMFRATHRPFAPWTVVDFNNQRRGRLNLIHHLVTHVPYRQLADPPVTLPPLPQRPKRERFTWRLKPIRGWY